MPAVVYGLGHDAVSVTVDYRDLRGALSTEAGLNVVLNLEFGEQLQLALVKELQRHPVRGDVTHVDFVRVDPDADVAVDVPIRLTGEASAVLDMNGIVDQSLAALRVLAKPRSIPNSLTIDITDLTVGTALTVRDVELPPGVVCLVPETAPVVSGIITRMALEEATSEEEDEETDAEGDEAAEDDAGDSD
ncbi:MAG: 50S ribosomal protein L25 [Acidimicrobiia bacterium]|nr:50S ribosomal protein L25 [Acidimicrobiia bacterium]